MLSFFFCFCFCFRHCSKPIRQFLRFDFTNYGTKICFLFFLLVSFRFGSKYDLFCCVWRVHVNGLSVYACVYESSKNHGKLLGCIVFVCISFGETQDMFIMNMYIMNMHQTNLVHIRDWLVTINLTKIGSWEQSLSKTNQWIFWISFDWIGSQQQIKW